MYNTWWFYKIVQIRGRYLGTKMPDRWQSDRSVIFLHHTLYCVTLVQLYRTLTCLDVSIINHSINQGLPMWQSYFKVNCLYKECSDDNVRIWFPEEPGFKLLTEGIEHLRRRYLLWQVFQTRGPATVNARSPTVERLTDGTIKRLVPPERSVRRPGWSATGTSGPRYRGALPCKTLYFSTATLQSICSRTRSQWRQARASVMWSADPIR